MIMRRKNGTDTLIIHCSATPPNWDQGAAGIDRMHRQRGFSKIGYHWVIRRDGTAEPGRAEHVTGSHCRDQGMNHRSIGICLIGGVDKNLKAEDNFTPPQWERLGSLVNEVLIRYPTIKQICGHRDVKDVRKECPCFDVRQWLKDTMPTVPTYMIPKAGKVT